MTLFASEFPSARTDKFYGLISVRLLTSKYTRFPIKIGIVVNKKPRFWAKNQRFCQDFVTGSVVGVIGAQGLENRLSFFEESQAVGERNILVEWCSGTFCEIGTPIH